MNKYQISKTRNFSAHRELRHTAENFLNQSKKGGIVCDNSVFVSIVMSCLTIEAFCNAVLHLIIDDWSDYENAGPKIKIRVICDKLGIQYDKSKEPFQGLTLALSIRNMIAHGKPEFVNNVSEVGQAEVERAMGDHLACESKLEKRLTYRNAEIILKNISDFETLILDRVPLEVRVEIESDIYEARSDLINN